MSLACVVTTIQPPTDCIRALSERLSDFSSALYIIGDKKGPTTFDVPGARFFSLGR